MRQRNRVNIFSGLSCSCRTFCLTADPIRLHKFAIYLRRVASYRPRVKPALLFVLLLGLVASVSRGASPLVLPAEHECRRAIRPIKLDGKADEPAWQQAVVIDSFAAFWAKRPGKTATKARLLWDDQYLYFHAEMEDADLYADERKTNGHLWANDVFELFFKPSDQSHAYYEFQINPLNAQLHCFMPSRGAGGMQRAMSSPADAKFNMKTAVLLRGTLNNWRDNDTGWSVEGRIPWQDFHHTNGGPTVGDTWRFALCRYDYSKNYESPDLTSCAPLTQSSFHRYEVYCRLKFVAPAH
jgi:Carbohydrate family 9 binding domain-like